MAYEANSLFVYHQVGKEMMIPGGAKVIDASGKLVLPGGIDTSVHLQQTFMNATIQEDFYSGTKVHTHTPLTSTDVTYNDSFMTGLARYSQC